MLKFDMSLSTEFERQVENLIQKKYPEMAGISEADFLTKLNPLKLVLESLSLPEVDLENGTLPFVIVIKSEVVDTENAMSKVDKDGKNGTTKLYPLKPKDFETIDKVDIPESKAYLLIDIDRGKESLNVRPCDAFITIKENDRQPLTMDEGVAIVTQFPDFLIKNNCFSLLASRHTGDKRVPAIWINASKNPNLGWCWDGNPHTWLGSASCKKRIGSKD